MSSCCGTSEISILVFPGAHNLWVWVSSEDVPQIEIEEQLVEVPVTKHGASPIGSEVQKGAEIRRRSGC